jgi:hypothetical protein
MATKAKPTEPEQPDNLAIWNALGKTDPKHTKPFSRAGGFKGTAIKPIWIVHRLTEQFGPCGHGWGIGEPRFEVVPGDGEVMVYCTVKCWYDDGDEFENRNLYGVGGDKVVTKRNDGKLFHDDEAFKKAFTDAVGNAFKFVGVGADVHMGLFEDSKYLAEVKQEFAEPANDTPPDEPAPREKLEGKHSSKTALATALRAYGMKVGLARSVGELLALTEEYADDLEQARRYLPKWMAGDPEQDSKGLTKLTDERRTFLELLDRMRENETARALSSWLGAYSAEIEALDDAQGREFEKELAAFEAGLSVVATVNAG